MDFGRRALFLILYFCALAWSTKVEFRPFTTVPSGVAVTSTRLPDPSLTAFALSDPAINPDRQWSVELAVADCASPQCQIDMFVMPADDADTFHFHLRPQVFGLVPGSAGSGGSGRYNTSWLYLNPASTHTNGVWQLFVVLSTASTNGRTRSYTTAELTTQFNAGTVSFAGAPDPIPGAWATLDYFSVSPTAVTSTSAVLSVAAHLSFAAQTGANVEPTVKILCQPTVSGLSAFWCDIYNQGDGWFNFTNALDRNEFVGAGGGWAGGLSNLSARGEQACSVALTDLNNVVGGLSWSASQLRAQGFNPSITLTGSVFSADLTPPHCNFSLGSGASVNVTSVAARPILTPTCDEPLAEGGVVWYLAPPPAVPPAFLFAPFGREVAYDNGQAAHRVNIPAGAPSGDYPVHSVIVADLAGNVAVYSNHDPPLTDGARFAVFDDADFGGPSTTVALNAIWTAQGSGSSSSTAGTDTSARMSSSSGRHSSDAPRTACSCGAALWLLAFACLCLLH